MHHGVLFVYAFVVDIKLLFVIPACRIVAIVDHWKTNITDPGQWLTITTATVISLVWWLTVHNKMEETSLRDLMHAAHICYLSQLIVNVLHSCPTSKLLSQPYIKRWKFSPDTVIDV